MAIQEGDKAPDIKTSEFKLAEQRGKRVVLFFYPKSDTPGCTKEACDFRDNLGELAGAGLTVLGISPDKPEKLAKFRDQESLNFSLLADPGREVLQAYGAFGEKTMYGKKTIGVIRSTFVIGADGRIERAYYNVRATGHVARLRQDLAA